MNRKQTKLKTSITGLRASIGKNYVLHRMKLSPWEACIYLNICPGELYRLSQEGIIHYFEPANEKPYFDLRQLAKVCEELKKKGWDTWSIAKEYRILKAKHENKSLIKWKTLDGFIQLAVK